MKMKVLLVFGTRPEAIKMCPVVKALGQQKGVKTIVCVTGQHKEMLAQVLQVFAVKPDYDLAIMKERQTLFDITIAILDRFRSILEKEKPDIILVHGDTTTAFAAALAGFYMNIPVGHVEAGLRTYNLQSPYPEEFNRQAVDIITDFYFAPTNLARQNLLKEGKKENAVFVTGNTVIDALKTTVKKEYKHEALDWAEGFRLILLTAHRRENLGEPLRNMFRAINRICMEFEDIKIIYPIHMNPAVRAVAREELAGNDRIKLIEPLDVLDFHNFMSRSYLILTDSGGIQEEAPALGKPVLVMRDTTERPEGIEAGTLKLVGTSEEGVYSAFRELLDNEEEYEKMSRAVNPYGDGTASEQITTILLDRLGKL